MPWPPASACPCNNGAHPAPCAGAARTAPVVTCPAAYCRGLLPTPREESAMTPAAGGPGTSDVPARRAALVALAAALDPREFAVTLTTRPVRRLCLSVTSRH